MGIRVRALVSEVPGRVGERVSEGGEQLGADKKGGGLT